MAVPLAPVAVLPRPVAGTGFTMKYFAYGSNMSIARLTARAPRSVPLGCHRLNEHDLRFHKAGADGSGKCDAFFTGIVDHGVYGVLYDLDTRDKPALDRVEGLGYGYDEKRVTVLSAGGSPVEALTYVATRIDRTLKPFTWYVSHVLIGSREASLPPEYVHCKISSVASVEDADRLRDASQRAIHLDATGLYPRSSVKG